jgi:hypothetical protein
MKNKKSHYYLKTSLILMFGILACRQLSYAQLQKGNILLGGVIGLTNSETEYEFLVGTVPGGKVKAFNFTFSPNVSVFIAKRFSLGVELPVSYENSHNSYAKSWSTTYLIGPVVRYYFPFSKWALFPQLNYALGGLTSKGPRFSPSTGDLEDTKISGMSTKLKAGVGLTYFINPNIAIEGLLFYQRETHAYDNDKAMDMSQSSLNFNFGVQAYINSREN